MDLIDRVGELKKKKPSFKPNPKSQARANAAPRDAIADKAPTAEATFAEMTFAASSAPQPAMQSPEPEEAERFNVKNAEVVTHAEEEEVQARSRAVRFAVSEPSHVATDKEPPKPPFKGVLEAPAQPSDMDMEAAAVSSLLQIKSRGKARETSQRTKPALPLPLPESASAAGVNGWKQLLTGMRDSRVSEKSHSSAGKRARGSNNTDEAAAADDGAAPATTQARRRRRPKKRAIAEEEEEEVHEDEPFEERFPYKKRRKTKGKPTMHKQLSAAGLASVRMPKVNEDEDVDVESWSIRQIIAKGQSWDNKLIKASKKAAKEAKESQAAAEGEGAAASMNAAGPSNSNAAGPSSSAALVVPSSMPSSSAPAPAAASLGPRLQVINGQIVLDAASLTIQAQRADDSSNYTRIEEGNRLINSHSYMKRTPGERWGSDETDLFYRALRHFGTDFTLIAQLFPKRDRKHIKNKYNKEIKTMPSKVNDALIGRGKNPEETKELFNVILSNQRTAAQQIEAAS